jgi:hypothetical protein
MHRACARRIDPDQPQTRSSRTATAWRQPCRRRPDSITRTIALLTGSNAIDGTIAGDCFDSQSDPISVDQRGFPRTQGACDVGAFEQDDVFTNGFE